MGKNNVKYTYEKVEKICQEYGFELISKEYINSNQILIIKDKDGYILTTSLTCLRLGKMPVIFYKNNPYIIHNIKLWLKLNNSSYVLISEKIDGKQNIIVKDNEGYYYSSILCNIMHGNLSKFGNNNPYTIQNIKLWCKLNNKPYKLVSNIYIKNNKNLEWQCLKDGCGEIFEAPWGSINNGVGCGVCDGHQVRVSNCLATKNPKLASEWHPTKNGSLTPYDVTLNNPKKVWWQCSVNPKHEWDAQISNRNSCNNGCPYCSGRYATEENNLLVYNPKLCEEWDYEKNDKRPEDYTPMSGEKVWWLCKECGFSWKINISNRGHKSHGNNCPECSESKGEIKIREWLRLSNINYIPQKQFEGLIGLGGGLLSYDFYTPEYNLLVEYQGEQHEKFCRGVHKSIKDFEKQLEHDRRKKEYALLNGYNFLEIWYYNFDNVEIILEEYLSNIKKPK